MQVLRQADCILAVGMALNPYQTVNGRLAPDARFIQVDREADRIGQFSSPDVAIVADGKAAARALNRRFDAASQSRADTWVDAEARALIADARKPPTASEADGAERLPISAFLAAMNSSLPPDRVVILDAGLFLVFTIDAIAVQDPESFVWSLDFGSIGLGFPMAIGATLGKPGRRCILFTGDGGFSMSLQELETAVRERVPLTVVVLNDGAYAPEARFLKMRDKPPDLGIYRDIDFAAVARAFGGQGTTVRTVSDVSAAAALATEADGLLVIDAKVSEDEPHRSLQPGVFFPEHAR
jgi:thiamine pyrophosphate-dependent acetolactate synthase large subunit-like protein